MKIIPTYVEDAPRHLGGLYMYWNLKQYRELLAAEKVRDFPGRFPYAPKSEKTLDAFERELGGYVVWSVGPGGWKPFLEDNVPMFLPYDPTNGTTSPGALFRSEKTNPLNWVDYAALEDF
jgi:hypothetical protein